MCEAQTQAFHLSFNRNLRVGFQGSKESTDIPVTNIRDRDAGEGRKLRHELEISA